MRGPAVLLGSGPGRPSGIELPLSALLGRFSIEMYRRGSGQIGFKTYAQLKSTSHEEGRRLILQVLQGVIKEIEAQAPSAPVGADTVRAG